MNLREAAQQAAPREQLLKELMDSRVPKTEREHAAVREIERLRTALADTQDWDEVEALRASLREHMAEIHRLREAGQIAINTLFAIRDGATGLWGDDLDRCNNALEHLVEDFAEQPVTDCHEKEGGKLSPPFDHIPDATKMMATVREDRTVEPVAYVTGYSKGYATVKPVDPCLLMCVGMALYRSPPKREPFTDAELEPIRRRMMFEAYNAADDDDSERYNALKVMANDVLEMLMGVKK